MNSMFSSFQTVPFFKGAFRYLNKHPLTEKNSVVIGRTRHKILLKYSLPRKFDGLEIVWKEYTNTRFWRFFLRPSFAEREANGFRIAEKAGLSVPRVLAFGNSRSHFKLKSCFIVTEYLKNTQNGSVFTPGGTMARDSARKIYAKLTLQQIAKLHLAGYVYGSLLPDNVLWRLNNDSRMEIFFVDPVSVRARSGRRLLKEIRHDLLIFLDLLGFDPETTGQMINYYNRIRKSLSPDAKNIEF